MTQLKLTVYELENFHFSYNAVCSKPTNKLEKIYSTFSISLRNCNDKIEAKNIIKKLTDQLSKIYVSYQEFESEFINLTYTKSNNPNNVITKYVINKIASYYADKEIFEDDGSIEHILPESDDAKNNNIGNLILLEQGLNQEADCLEYIDKITLYKKSSYKWIKEFVNSNTEWSYDKIQERSKKLSEFYYTKILAKDISLNASKQ